MKSGTPRRYSLQDIVSIFDDDNTLKRLVYLDNFIATPLVSPVIADNLTGVPFRFEMDRFILFKRGVSHTVIGLVDMDLKAGDLVYVSSNTITQLNAHSDAVDGMGLSVSREVMHMAMQGNMPSAFDGHLPYFVLHLSDDEFQFVETLLTLIYRSIEAMRQAGDMSQSSVALANHLLAAFLTYVDSAKRHDSQQRQGAVSRDSEIFARFLSLVNCHASVQHGIDFYASQLCITPRYMGSVVKQVSGRTAKDWIDQALLNQIKVELRHTTKPVGTISDELGFANTSFFSKFFRRLTGLTPKEYRQSLLSAVRGD